LTEEHYIAAKLPLRWQLSAATSSWQFVQIRRWCTMLAQ
jgi:hypothetical protein